VIYLVSTLLTLSVLVNIFFVFYSRWLAKKLATNQIFVEDLWKIMQDFSKHLGIVNELEMFYGDETLKALMMHSSEIVKTIDDYDLIIDDQPEDDVESLEEDRATNDGNKNED
jgi:hypothetical protein